MGYFRDDTPLSELILDEKGQKELEALWDEFEFVADYTARTYIQFFFNQSGEVLGNGRESGQPSSGRQGHHRRNRSSSDFTKTVSRQGRGRRREQSRRVRGDRRSLRRVNATIRGVERKRLEAEPQHLDALLAFAARAYRRPLTTAERDDLRGVLSHRCARRAA